MDVVELERRRCAGGECDSSMKAANQALKGVRYVLTAKEPALAGDGSGGCAAADVPELSAVDITDAADIPSLVWEYTESSGPVGRWTGEATRWSWRDWVAALPQATYSELFASCGIRRFVIREVPGLRCPMPGMHGDQWEFSVTRDDGVVVHVHPPGKGKNVMHTRATDEERRAALAAVAKRGVSERIRAAWTQPGRKNPAWPDQTAVVGPDLLEGGRQAAAAALAAPPAQREGPARCFAHLLERVRALQAAHGGACFGGDAAASSAAEAPGAKRAALAAPATQEPTAQADSWAWAAEDSMDLWHSWNDASGGRGDWSTPPAAPQIAPAARTGSGALPSRWPLALAPEPGVRDIREEAPAAPAAVDQNGPSLQARAAAEASLGRPLFCWNPQAEPCEAFERKGPNTAEWSGFTLEFFPPSPVPWSRSKGRWWYVEGLDPRLGPYSAEKHWWHNAGIAAEP